VLPSYTRIFDTTHGYDDVAESNESVTHVTLLCEQLIGVHCAPSHIVERVLGVCSCVACV